MLSPGLECNSTLNLVSITTYLSFNVFYLSRLHTLFFYPYKPSQVELKGVALERENEISNLPREEKDLDQLITFDNLSPMGFYNQEVASVLYVEFKKKLSKKLLKKKSKCLTGKGRGLAYHPKLSRLSVFINFCSIFL